MFFKGSHEFASLICSGSLHGRLPTDTFVLKVTTGNLKKQILVEEEKANATKVKSGIRWPEKNEENPSDDGEEWEKDAKYFYYLHGSLARVEKRRRQNTGHGLCL